MYQPAEFREHRLSALHEHIARHGFGILVSHGSDGFAATHTPFLLTPDAGELGLLTSHLAKRNAQTRAVDDGAEVLVVFPGPQAYVSAQWYTAEPDVPTWNYTAVHVHGRFRRLTGAEATLDVLRRTVRTFEGGGADAWQLDQLDPELVTGLARGVVAFEVDITDIQGGVKLSQDKLPEDVAAVVGGLRSRGSNGAAAVATTMEELGVRGRNGTPSTDPTSY